MFVTASRFLLSGIRPRLARLPTADCNSFDFTRGPRVESSRRRVRPGSRSGGRFFPGRPGKNLEPNAAWLLY